MKKILYFLILPFIAIYLVGCNGSGGSGGSGNTPSGGNSNTINVTSEPGDITSIVNGENIKLTFSRNSALNESNVISGNLSGGSTPLGGKTGILCTIPANGTSCSYEYSVPGNVADGPYVLTLNSSSKNSFSYGYSNGNGKIQGTVYKTSLIRMSTSPRDVSLAALGESFTVHFSLAAREAANMESQEISLKRPKGWDVSNNNKCTITNDRRDCSLNVVISSTSDIGAYTLSAVNNTADGIGILDNDKTITVTDKAMINVTPMSGDKEINLRKVVRGEEFTLNFTPTGLLPSGDDSVTIAVPDDFITPEGKSCQLTSSLGCSIPVQVSKTAEVDNPFKIDITAKSALELSKTQITGTVVAAPVILVNTNPETINPLVINTPLTIQFTLANAESLNIGDQDITVSVPNNWSPNEKTVTCKINSSRHSCPVTLTPQTTGGFDITYSNSGNIPIDGTGHLQGEVRESSIVNVTTSPAKLNSVVPGEIVTLKFELTGGAKSTTVTIGNLLDLFTPLDDLTCTAAPVCTIRVKANKLEKTIPFSISLSSPVALNTSYIDGTLYGTTDLPKITVDGLPKEVTVGNSYTLTANLENSIKDIATQTVKVKLPNGWTAPSGTTCSLNNDIKECPIVVTAPSTTADSDSYRLEITNSSADTRYTVPVSPKEFTGKVVASPLIAVSTEPTYTTQLAPGEVVKIDFDATSAGATAVSASVPSGFTAVGKSGCTAAPTCSIKLKVNDDASDGNYSISLTNETNLAPFVRNEKTITTIEGGITHKYPQIAVTLDQGNTTLTPGKTYTLTAKLSNSFEELPTQTVSFKKSSLPTGWTSSKSDCEVTHKDDNCTLTVSVPSNATVGSDYTLYLQNSPATGYPVPLTTPSIKGSIAALPAITVSAANNAIKQSSIDNAIALIGTATKTITLAMTGGNNTTPTQTVLVGTPRGAVKVSSNGGSANSETTCNISYDNPCTVTIYAGKADNGIGQLSFTNKTSSDPASINLKNLTVLWAPTSKKMQYEAVFNVSVDKAGVNSGSWGFETASDHSGGLGVHGLPDPNDPQPYSSKEEAYLPFAGTVSDFSSSNRIIPKLYLTYPPNDDFNTISVGEACNQYNFVKDTGGKDSIQGEFSTDTAGIKDGQLGYFTARVRVIGSQKFSVHVNDCSFISFSQS